jgi:hypothetical protein
MTLAQCLDDANNQSLLWKQILSAVFYGLASFMITVINKTVLTTYEFPSFQVLGIGQMVATIVVLFMGKKLRIVSFPSFELNTFSKIFPLPLIYIGNMLFGLGGTKQLSLPMFTALRRFSILMTMILELYILGVRPSFSVQFSVYTMIIGCSGCSKQRHCFQPARLHIRIAERFLHRNQRCIHEEETRLQRIGKIWTDVLQRTVHDSSGDFLRFLHR